MLSNVESAAARRPSSHRVNEPVYLGVRLPAALFRRLMGEVVRRGLDLDEAVARALVEGWLSGPVIDGEAKPADEPRRLPGGRRAP